MAKMTAKASLKGKLDLDFNIGSGTITEVTKDAEKEYDFFEILSQFNGKTVTIQISEENDIPTVGDSE